MLEALRKLFGKRPPDIVPEPEKPPEQAPQPAEPAPWQSGMLLQAVGPGENASYPGYSCGTTRIRWVSRETDESGQPLSVREPKPKTLILPMALFTAAGKAYHAPHELAEAWFTKGGVDWCRDKYGRRVLYDAERFPCFDSGDFLYEKRYFRWFFLYENGKLTRVQHTDERGVVTVTEDVRDVEDRWLQELQKLDCFK